MENQFNSNQNCGCSDGSCCIPQKKNSPWKKWIFIAIILAAAAIITVKLINKDDEIPVKCCDKTENTTEKCCDKTETKSCCPKSKSDNNE